jgi:hypothetical protein
MVSEDAGDWKVALMSRIVRAPYKPGDLADPARLNTEFSQFSQAGAIDGMNLRDAAIDLPQIAVNTIRLNAATANIGTGAAGWQHTTPNSAPSSAATPATKTPIVDAVGTATPLGPIAWTMAVGEFLRVYWDLSVRPVYTGSPWVGADGQFDIFVKAGGGAVQAVNDGGHCWLISLQWDITSAALLNWVDVSGQTSYTSAVGGRVGGKLSDSPASAPVPAWKYTAINIDEGEWRAPDSSIQVEPAGWTSANGAWYYIPTGAITIYGLRLVIHGIYHAAQTATENYLVVDTAVADPTVKLEYDGGALMALHQRIGS